MATDYRLIEHCKFIVHVYVDNCIIFVLQLRQSPPRGILCQKRRISCFVDNSGLQQHHKLNYNIHYKLRVNSIFLTKVALLHSSNFEKLLGNMLCFYRCCSLPYLHRWHFLVIPMRIRFTVLNFICGSCAAVMLVVILLLY